MTAIFLMLALPVMVAAIVVWLVNHAPEGYEDNSGFHLGRESVRLR